jgi:hypothetical protein
MTEPDYSLDRTLSRIGELAADVGHNRRTRDDVARELAELCTRHGPAAVQALDEYFEAETARIRSGKERAP